MKKLINNLTTVYIGQVSEPDLIFKSKIKTQRHDPGEQISFLSHFYSCVNTKKKCYIPTVDYNRLFNANHSTNI